MQICALSVGPAVDVRSPGRGCVHSVFARAVNLAVEADMWTLLGPERDDLPFGIRVQSHDFDALGLRRGDPVSIRSGFVGIGAERARIVVDCRNTPRWMPGFEREVAPGIADRLDVVRAAASGRAWRASASMASAVIFALSKQGTLADVLAGIVGNGPGSTPAGDDVLIGVLAVLRSPCTGRAGLRTAEALRAALLPLLPRTTDLSAHLLRQAADGLFSRAVDELLGALIGDPAPARLMETVQRVVGLGATSGADTCMGILVSAPAFLRVHPERAAA